MPKLPEPEYVTADTIEKYGAIATVINSGGHDEREGKRGKYKAPYVFLDFKAVQKKFTMNSTTQKTLAKTWGDNTDEWVGKQMELFSMPQNVGGEIKDVVYARPKKEAA